MKKNFPDKSIWQERYFFSKNTTRFAYLILFIRLLDWDIENSDSGSNFLFDSNLTTSPRMSNTETICDSDVEVVWFLCVPDVEADPVCTPLDKPYKRWLRFKGSDLLQVFR